MGIPEEYGKLRKKYSLPELKSIDRDFEVSKIENAAYLIREIDAAMMEKLELTISVVAELLQPDTNNVASMHEFRTFDDKGKVEVYDFYKRLMILHRKGLNASYSGDEKEEAEFLKTFAAEWNQIKPRMREIASRLEKSWEDDTEYKNELGYLG